MTKLRISPDLALPIEAVTEAIGFLGRRGSGKSYLAQKLAEQMHAAGAQFVALDPVGNWWALRLAADGKSPGLPITIFGGLQGDLPIDATAGQKVADIIVDRRISAVIDVSQFESDAAKARFARDFCERFYFRKKSAPAAVFLFLEEAQEFIPQNPTKDEPLMLHAFTRLAKLGRNFGIGIGMLSQRPQEVNKKVLNLCELLFVFQLTGTHERKAVEAWIGDKGIEGEDIDAELPKLERGHPHAWSPAWLKTSRIIEVGRKQTYDASSTPKVGAAAAPVRELSPIDIEQLRKDMAASIEKAKADDPRELRKEIAALKKQIASAPTKTVEKSVTVVDQKAIERAVATAVKPYTDVLVTVKRAVSALASPAQQLSERLSALQAIDFDVKPHTNGNGHHSPHTQPVPQRSAPLRSERVPHSYGRSQGLASHEGMKPGQQKIVNALAELEVLGVQQSTRHQLGMVAGYNLTGGTGAQHIADLVAAGLVELPDKGAVRLTDSGRAMASVDDVPTSLHELHERVLRKLPDGQRRIAEHLISIYPDSISRAELGAQVGYNLTGGTGAQHVADLVTVGAAKIPGSGKVVASDLLFPEGLG